MVNRYTEKLIEELGREGLVGLGLEGLSVKTRDGHYLLRRLDVSMEDLFLVDVVEPYGSLV